MGTKGAVGGGRGTSHEEIVRRNSAVCLINDLLHLRRPWNAIATDPRLHSLRGDAERVREVGFASSVLMKVICQFHDSKMEQYVPNVKNNMFVEHIVRISDTYAMPRSENNDPKRAVDAKKTQKLQLPLWAIRLEIALLQAGFVDKKGKVDKKKVGEKFLVGPKAVEHWLNGAREPRFAVMVELHRLTGLSLDWLFGAEESRPFVSASTDHYRYTQSNYTQSDCKI
ncbi:hypothetical protein [Methylocystis parvus]|uniref:hypothetical protein n=1 Tax=Methylocystis parvus TaxID=134 RepID=UPI003C72E993